VFFLLPLHFPTRSVLDGSGVKAVNSGLHPVSEDTELGALMEPEVSHGETEVYARVRA
jgi:hypothetical protein